MSVYLDASVLLPMIVKEPNSAAVDRFIADVSEAIWVGEFAAAEVASALSRLVRTGTLSEEDARERLSDFDAWRAAEAVMVEVQGGDVRSAGVIVRRFELMLRTPDALHIATCRRSGSSLATLDQRLASAAQALDVKVVTPLPAA